MSGMNLYRLLPKTDGKREASEVLDGGWEAIYLAISLWRLCGSSRGDELHRLLIEEIEPEDSEGHRIMNAQRIQGVLELLDGLDQAIAGIVDANQRLPPERVAAAQKLDPPVTELMMGSDGVLGHEVTNALLRVVGLRVFLQLALREGAEVALD